MESELPQSVIDKIFSVVQSAISGNPKKEKKQASPEQSKKRKSPSSEKAAKKEKTEKKQKKKLANPSKKLKVIKITVPRVEDDSSTDESSGAEEVAKEKKIKKIGTKREVFHGKAQKTSGGLVKADIIKSRSGRIVSKAASEKAQLNWAKRQLIPSKKEVAAPVVNEASNTEEDSEGEEGEIHAEAAVVAELKQ